MLSGISRSVDVSGGSLKVNFSAMSNIENYGPSNILPGPNQFINLDNGFIMGMD
ncbi:hypothetical protein [Chryseobacterium lathyri]|uniref:hypothetical protein n=1 Tax=Chryseobacterium lathyri TaxID=395933 RepID=UPI00278AD0FC|nr:hypothetical protein [Chryseobacterium lathyri]MDQ0065538.1 hypothetical protein [Chryseobacterium lathyri]